MTKPAHSTGLISPFEQGCPSSDAVTRPPGAAWITDDMIEDTKQHWSPRYQRELSSAEAVEILMNVKRLAQLLIRIGGEQS